MILFLLSVMLIVLLGMYFCDGYYLMEPKIKFTQFKNFYSVNPDRWRLQHGDVACITGIKRIELRFGFIDYYRYKLWRRSIIKNEAKQKSQKRWMKLLLQ